MNAKQVINRAYQQGLKLAADNGKLVISGAGDKQKALTPELKALLVRMKPQIIPLLTHKKGIKVVKLVVDGKPITCIDPTSTTNEEAIQSQIERWGSRATNIKVMERH